jgi:hypothetical protein
VLTAYAYCIDPVIGYAVVGTNGQTGTGPIHTVDVSCPQGKRLIGVGATAAVEDGRHVVLTLLMTYGGERTIAQAHDEWDSEADRSYETETWTMHVSAVCIDAVYGVEVKTTSVAHPKPEGYLSVAADCPVGKTPTAAGGGIFNGGSQVGLDALGVLSPIPNPTQGVTVAVEDPVGTDADWYMHGAVVCIPGPQ